MIFFHRQLSLMFLFPIVHLSSFHTLPLLQHSSTFHFPHAILLSAPQSAFRFSLSNELFNSFHFSCLTLLQGENPPLPSSSSSSSSSLSSLFSPLPPPGLSLEEQVIKADCVKSRDNLGSRDSVSDLEPSGKNHLIDFANPSI